MIGCAVGVGAVSEAFHHQPYDPARFTKTCDPYVKNRRGIFEYVLGGSVDTKLLSIRVFDDATKKNVYAAQTAQAEAKGQSNCPLCAIGHDANKSKIWKLTEMDADHVAAWSRGGATDIRNCQMLCRTHNQAKGNR